MKTQRIGFNGVVTRFMAAVAAGVLGVVAAGAATLHVGPGQTYTTIQAAINAATAGDTIIVAAGTYTEQVGLTKTLTLQGANAGVSAGAVPGTRGLETIVDGGFYIQVAAHGTVIDGFTIQNGYQYGGHKNGIGVGGQAGAVTDVKIQNNILKDVAGSQSQGIEVVAGCNNLLVRNNEIVNNWRGVYLNAASGVTFEGNAIHANNGVGVGIGSSGQVAISVVGNAIYDHTVEGWGMDTLGAGSVATNNAFYNNKVSIAHYSGASLDATLNYWGSAGGSGATVSGNVDADPYWQDAAKTILGSASPVQNVTKGLFYNAIQAAVTAATSGDLITIKAGTYTENVYIDKSLNIVGAGAAPTIVDGGAADSVIFVDGDIDVSIEGLTIQNGSAATGGGIYVQADGSMNADLAVYDCVFKNNVATTGNGGALANLGLYEAVVLDGCTFSGNTALNGQGGAVSIIDGFLTMANCTVSGNAAKNGGGCAFNSGASIALDHVTVTLNTATSVASSKGGGLYPNGASGTMANSIICGNTDQFSGTTTDNVNGTIPGGSNNLVDQDAMLGALADNGGPTPTHKLLAGSPAINNAAASAVTVDQRGVPRAQGNAPDIGAYEVVFIAYVDDDYTAESCGGHVWGQDAFATLATAIAAVADSGTIRVAAGTYAGGQTINGSLTFEGANKDVAGYGTRGPESVITTTIHVKGQNNTVSFNGFQFTASNYALLYGAAPSTTDWIFKNNLVAGGSGCACYNEGTSNWRDVTVVSNMFTVTGGSSALRLANVRNLSVKDNRFSGGFNALQLVGASGDVLVDGNEISNTTNEALKFGGPIQNGVCSNNTISNANTSGEADVGAIRIRGVALPYKLTIINNTLIDSFNGVAVKNGENLAGATILVTGNNFNNNTNAGIYNGGTGTLTADGNYWGSATPDIDALVIGDVVTDSFYADAARTDLRFYAVYVDDSFATESGNQFKTIQGGVDAVSPYGTVHVAAGAYAGVTLVKSVKLLGANAGVAGYGTRADESVVSSVVNMTGADTSVMIDGFKFAVTPHLMFGANLAESKQTADWTFQNNLVEASGAIYSEVGNVNLNWRDVVVTRNRFANMTSNAVITHNVRSLTATDNQFDTLGAGGNALVCQNITSLEVAGNSFSNIGWNAVQLVGAESVTITNNVCSNLGAEAFKLGGPIVSGVCSYNTIVGANTSKEIDVGGIRIRVAAGQPLSLKKVL